MLNADQVSRATRCPLGNVAEIWPLVLRALADQGIDNSYHIHACFYVIAGHGAAYFGAVFHQSFHEGGVGGHVGKDVAASKVGS